MDFSRVLGVLNGTGVQDSWLRSWMDSATLILAADGGARHVLAAGRRPNFVIGDLDSLNSATEEMGESVIRIDDQNTSDTDKLLDFLAKKGARKMSLICMEGDRLDHVLATLGSCAQSDLEIRLLMPRNTAHIVKEASAKEIQIETGRRVSVLPLGKAVVSLTGVQWTLDHAELSLGGLVSLSNIAVEPRVLCTVYEGAVAFFAEAKPGDVPTW